LKKSQKYFWKNFKKFLKISEKFSKINFYKNFPKIHFEKKGHNLVKKIKIKVGKCSI